MKESAPWVIASGVLAAAAIASGGPIVVLVLAVGVALALWVVISSGRGNRVPEPDVLDDATDDFEDVEDDYEDETEDEEVTT